MRAARLLSSRASSLHTATGACLRRQMGASASTPKAGTTRDDVFPAGSLRFTSTPAVDAWLAGGAPPPRSDASELLRNRAEALIQQLVVKGRDNENLATPSPQRALQAYKAKYGADAAAKAFGDEDDYLASIDLPVAVKGTSKRRWWLGDGTPRGDRYFDARSEDAKEILAVAHPSGAAALAAPGGATGAGGDANRPWEGLELVPSSDQRDLNLNFWEGVVCSTNWPYQNAWDDGNWPGDAPPPKWGVLIKSPSGRKPPTNTTEWYRGPLPRRVTHQYKMTKDACGSDATMLEHWARAAFYTQRLAEILKMERKAFENMRDAWEAMGNGGSGRPTRGPRQSYRPEDDYAALTRAKTDKLIVEEPATHYGRHLNSLKTQLAHNEPLLEAIAKDVDVPRSVLTALDSRNRAYLLSPVIKVNFPGLGPNLVKGNWDHTDEGWKNDPSVAIRELRLRRLTWGKFNEKLPGYEWYLANAAARAHLDAYLNSTLCFDRSFGGWFQLEIPIKDEAKLWGKKTDDQQHDELYYIRNHLLKGAILGATEGHADATGRDAELLRILRERWGAELVFVHAPCSDPGGRGIAGQFWAPDFMGRGETYFRIDHIALGCVRRKGVLYRIVGVRGLLPQDMNLHASGYEFIKVLGLESWVEDYLKNAYCEKGVGGLDKSKALFDYRPDVFRGGAMRPV